MAAVCKAVSPELYFYPRSPCGERLTVVYNIVFVPGFLSTLSLRRATAVTNERAYLLAISIHALLAESDDRTRRGQRHHPISIHALLAESDA